MDVCGLYVVCIFREIVFLLLEKVKKNFFEGTYRFFWVIYIITFLFIVYNQYKYKEDVGMFVESDAGLKLYNFQIKLCR